MCVWQVSSFCIRDVIIQFSISVSTRVCCEQDKLIILCDTCDMLKFGSVNCRVAKLVYSVPLWANCREGLLFIHAWFKLVKIPLYFKAEFYYGVSKR